jgi:hypothetical protein
VDDVKQAGHRALAETGAGDGMGEAGQHRLTAELDGF